MAGVYVRFVCNVLEQYEMSSLVIGVDSTLYVPQYIACQSRPQLKARVNTRSALRVLVCGNGDMSRVRDARGRIPRGSHGGLGFPVVVFCLSQ